MAGCKPTERSGWESEDARHQVEKMAKASAKPVARGKKVDVVDALGECGDGV